MTIPADAVLPFTLRLNALEAKIVGTPAYSVSSADKASVKLGESSKSAQRRLNEIQQRLEAAQEGNEGLKRIISNYETYLPLLSISDPSASLTIGLNDASDPSKAVTSSLKEMDVVPDPVKLTMVLEAAEDIKGIERDLREVEVLKSQGVEGAGSLEDILPLRPQLEERTRKAGLHARNVAQIRGQTTDLLVRYNEYTNTLSDLFLNLHRRLEELEEAVSKAERRKRKELAERY